jgi:hypothetical protein
MSNKNISDKQMANIINSHGYKITLAPMGKITNGYIDGKLIPSNTVAFKIAHCDDNHLAFYDKMVTADDIRTIRRVTIY